YSAPRLARSYGCPTRRRSAAHQVVRDLGRARRRTDAGEENLSGIRAAHAARPLGAVEGERIGAEVGTPERGLERIGETRRRALERARRLLAPNAPRTARRQALRRIDVALHLGERDRPFGQPPIGVEDRVERIL